MEDIDAMEAGDEEKELVVSFVEATLSVVLPRQNSRLKTLLEISHFRQYETDTMNGFQNR